LKTTAVTKDKTGEGLRRGFKRKHEKRKKESKYE
jgi:hypothetical protein